LRHGFCGFAAKRQPSLGRSFFGVAMGKGERSAHVDC